MTSGAADSGTPNLPFPADTDNPELAALKSAILETSIKYALAYAEYRRLRRIEEALRTRYTTTTAQLGRQAEEMERADRVRQAAVVSFGTYLLAAGIDRDERLEETDGETDTGTE